MEVARFFGFLHPALVHFPLVLLLVSVGLEAIGFFRRDTRFTWAAQALLLLGTVATLFAFVAGNFAEIWAARDGVPQDPMELHELLATITSWSFVFLCAGRLFLGMGANRKAMAGYLILATAACVLLIFTGHRGAMLVYEHGAGVHAVGLPGGPTHEDLQILHQKQELDALFYSNMMHHIFGWMVLIFAGILLIDTVSPRAGEKARRLMPVLLLAGGVFLMIFSDQDAWPLYHVHPFRPLSDKEVLMHKTYAVLMLLIGLRGLWRRKGKQAQTRKMQGRTMAVFALVGGALLFTHVHSNAPYANVAAGVYIHHTVMGLVALLIGAVRLMEDLLQERKQLFSPDPDSPNSLSPPKIGGRGGALMGVGGNLGKGMRALAWAYPVLMLAEALLLLNYNEGLPWFLGYRNLSIEGPHRGLIAPLGGNRAELCFDPDTQRLEMYLYDQAKDTPTPMSARDAEAVVKVGTVTTAVPLTPVGGDTAHYAGTAAFLRNTLMFETQVFFHPADASAESRPLIADFEPWIDPIALAPHTRKPYVCPMHESIGADLPGTCPLCGMALVPNRPPRPWGKLHDDGYRMDLALSAPQEPGAVPVRVASLNPPGPSEWSAHPKSGSAAKIYAPIASPQPGQSVRLALTPRRADGSVLRDLATVHTKKLHLIVVSQDLSYFDHVHPAPQPDGTLVLDYTFPHSGPYLLYADLTPTGDSNQVFRLPVTVAGSPPAQTVLYPDPAAAKTFGDYRVEMRAVPDPPETRDETMLTFAISRDGVPVTDLEPFLGAGGHCVALSADTQCYLHSHPLEMGGAHFGPEITFHVRFPRRGRYKLWAQFRHEGKPLTADFVMDVP